MIYGYIRVSTREQNTDRQLIALKEYGVLEENILTDKMSGKDFNRPNYKRLLKKIRKGDVVVVKSIDRLGRNYKSIIKNWQKITKDIGADIVVLDMPILNTGLHKDLIGTLISDIVLQLLSYVAENERVNIKQRQAEGIAAAKERGVRFGRPKKFNAEDYENVFERVRKREINHKQARLEIGCCETTYYKLKRKYNLIV